MMSAVSHLDLEGVAKFHPAGELLSSRLRMATAEARRQAEERLGLPGAVAERAGVVACLRRFRGLCHPLEARLQGFKQWAGLGIDLAGLSQAVRLDGDLEALEPGLAASLAASLAAPREALPHLPTFAHAVGGLYALATFMHDAATDLGRAGPDAAGAGRLPVLTEPVDIWRLRDNLDQYGLEWPGNISLAIEGGQRSFVAIGRWMDVRHWSVCPVGSSG